MLYLTAYVVLYEYDMVLYQAALMGHDTDKRKEAGSRTEKAVGCKDKMFGLGTIINVGVAVFSLGLNKKVNAGKYRVCICG